MYNANVYSRRSRRKRFRKLPILILLLLVIAIPMYFFFTSQPQATSIKKLTSQSQDTTNAASPTPTNSPLPDNSQGLANVIQNALSGTYGSYGVVVENLKTHEGYHQNENMVFEAGSLYKLWLMATVYQEVQNGQLHLSDTLQKDVLDLSKEFNVDPDPSEQTSGMLSLTVADALYQMITISDNNAALLLTDKIQVGAIESFLENNNFSESKVGITNKPPITTAYDITLFFEKLYNGDLADPTYTDSMLSLLKQQKLNEKLPKYLPYDVAVAHKTGELDNYSHDAGIVYSPNGDYIIVVLSKSDSPDLANERIALVSQAVYNYFTQNATTSSSLD